MEADKGYDACWLRQKLLNSNIFPLIPYRKMKGRNTLTMNEICEIFKVSKKGWQVERAFAWLNRRCRKLFLRWERIPKIWNGFAMLGVIILG